MNIKVGDKVLVPGWDPNKGAYDDYVNAYMAKVIDVKGNNVQVKYLDDGEIVTVDINELKKFENYKIKKDSRIKEKGKKTMKKRKKENVIEIKEDVKINQNNETVILEKGDKIQILSENFKYYKNEIESILPADQYGVRVQMSSSKGSTKWMNINKDFFDALESLKGEFLG